MPISSIPGMLFSIFHILTCLYLLSPACFFYFSHFNALASLASGMFFLFFIFIACLFSYFPTHIQASDTFLFYFWACYFSFFHILACLCLLSSACFLHKFLIKHANPLLQIPKAPINIPTMPFHNNKKAAHT